MEERKHIFEDANNGRVLDVRVNLLKSHSSALKCEGDMTAKLSPEYVKEAHSTFSDNGYAQTEEAKSHILPSVMISEVDAPEPECFVIDKLELLSRGAQEETEIRPEVCDVRSEHALKETSTKIARDSDPNDELFEGELQVSSFNGLSKYVREDIYSFYEEKQSGQRTILLFNGASTIASHSQLHENSSISHLSMPQNLKGAEESQKRISHATGFP